MLKRTNLKTRRHSKKLVIKLHRAFEVEKVITLIEIWVMLPKSWGIHDVCFVNLVEPYQTYTQREAMEATQVIRDYDNFIAEDYMIEEIMGCSYNK
jgi:hypothetical protein